MFKETRTKKASASAGHRVFDQCTYIIQYIHPESMEFNGILSGCRGWKNGFVKRILFCIRLQGI